MFSRSRSIESARARQSLDEAIVACRRSNATPSRLSAETRGKILQAALDGTRHSGPLPSLFFPVYRMLLVGLVPVIVVAAGLLLNIPRVGETGSSAIRDVHADKLGDQVVFTLNNGNGPHRVYRSTVPDRFDPASAIRVEHSRFVDSAASGPDLVFYWIE